MFKLSRSNFAQSLLAIGIATLISSCGGGAANPPQAQAAGSEESSPNTSTNTPTVTAEITGTPVDAADNNGSNETTDTVPVAQVDLSTPVLCDTEKQRFEEVMLARINAARAEARLCGSEQFPAVPSVTWNNKLQAAAELHSIDMTSHNFFSHTGSNGSSVSARADAQGYEWRAIGENIAAGQDTAQEVIEGWLGSDGHCRNLMNSNYTEIAVACVADPNADHQRYWTNVLGASLR